MISITLTPWFVSRREKGLGELERRVDLPIARVRFAEDAAAGDGRARP